jgi:hypothetical protein
MAAIGFTKNTSSDRTGYSCPSGNRSSVPFFGTAFLVGDSARQCKSWGTGAINLERCTARPIPRGRFSLHEPILRSRGGGFFAGYPINQGIAMKSQRSTPAKIARKHSAILASRYLDLQRLRDEVRKAETRGAPRRYAEGSEGQGRRPSEKAISVSE